MYVKNDIWVLKILEGKFLDQFPLKLDVFVLNLQYILILQEVGHDKTKETSSLKVISCIFSLWPNDFSQPPDIF